MCMKIVHNFCQATTEVWSGHIRICILVNTFVLWIAQFQTIKSTTLEFHRFPWNVGLFLAEGWWGDYWSKADSWQVPCCVTKVPVLCDKGRQRWESGGSGSPETWVPELWLVEGLDIVFLLTSVPSSVKQAMWLDYKSFLAVFWGCNLPPLNPGVFSAAAQW